jgi:hypothetical protein
MSLRLPPALTIGEVAGVREQLLQSLLEGELELDASGTTEIDAAGLQLLESAHRTALARGLPLRFVSGGMYQDVQGLSGATILGDGAVALIVDLPTIVRAASAGGASGPVEPW